MKNNVTAIILAAGAGTRMQLLKTKQTITICGESVLLRAVRAFSQCEAISSIIVVTRADELSFAKSELSALPKVENIVVGGECRQASAKIGFSYVSQECEYVAIHDAARCLVTDKIIQDVLCDAMKYGAATASSKVYDTVKVLNEEQNIIKTLPRDTLALMQTPQIFKTELYKKALESINSFDGITDDNMLLERIGIMPHCTDTGRYNIKITTKEDLSYANYILKEIGNEL